jgi:16S rRNA (cytosine967-C5)-methyltransferase
MENVTPRSLALELLLAVARKRESLDTLLPQLYESDLSGPDKGFARQLLMSTLRHHGQLGALVEGYLERPLEPKLVPVDWLLRMGAAQLLVLKTPAHAAIDTSVQLCKRLGFMHQAGMVNAILRKISANEPALAPAEYNLPSWLKGAWRKSYGREASALMAEQCLMEPPLDVFCKPDISLEGEELLAYSRRLANQDMTQLDRYDDGAFWAQDVAASLAVRAMGDVAGMRVLDLCAAPGGKTLQLCAGGAEVVAVDRSDKRLERLRENLARTQMTADLVVADMLNWQPEGPFNAVLLDAPCSATGTVRRHPDLLLRKTAKDITEMVALQREILHAIMGWLPADTPLIYAVCSLQPEEGEAQMEWLLSQHKDLRVEPITITDLPAEWLTPEGYIRTLPHYLGDKGGMDGFFVAKLRRT